MTKDEMEKLKKLLHERRDWLRDEIRNRMEQAHTSSSHKSTDIMDVASDAFDDELAMTLARQETEELHRVDQALDRLEEGKYGICEHCGKAIPFKRLKALPFATSCIECQQRQEEKERETGGEEWEEATE